MRARASALPAGVWSGCAFPTETHGTVVLNTAVRLRQHTPASLLPPHQRDLGLQMIECQTVAQANLDGARRILSCCCLSPATALASKRCGARIPALQAERAPLPRPALPDPAPQAATPCS